MIIPALLTCLLPVFILSFRMRKNKAVIVWLVFVFFSGLVLAQAEEKQGAEKEDEEKVGEVRKKDPFLKALWQDEKAILTSPFRIKGKDLLKWGGIALLTGVMIHNDEAIYRSFKDYQGEHEWVDKVSPTFSKMCEGYPYGAAGLFWLYGAVFKDGKAKETGELALQAMIHSFVVVQLVKHLTGRTRPSEFDGQDRWAGPSGFFKRYQENQWAKHDAFFSGHTITIWALATVVAHQYNDGFLVPFACYSLATLGGLATITEDLHWISDVFVGAVLGYAIARFVVKKRSSRFQVMPILQPDKMGLSFYYVF